jgi:hypothetical protein
VGRKEEFRERGDTASLNSGRNEEVIVPIFHLTSYRR